jgi:virginiamycin B lyase
MFVILLYIKPIEVEAIPSDQRTVLVKSWALPTSSTQDSGFAITSSFSGNEIYFVDSNSNKIGRLAPTTNLITEWNIPTANSLPTSIKFDPSTGTVYFVESNSNKIGRLVPFYNEFTEWNLQEKPYDIEIDSAGSIHYIDENGTKMVRMD